MVIYVTLLHNPTKSLSITFDVGDKWRLKSLKNNAISSFFTKNTQYFAQGNNIFDKTSKAKNRLVASIPDLCSMFLTVLYEKEVIVC